MIPSDRASNSGGGTEREVRHARLVAEESAVFRPRLLCAMLCREKVELHRQQLPMRAAIGCHHDQSLSTPTSPMETCPIGIYFPPQYLQDPLRERWLALPCLPNLANVTRFLDCGSRRTGNLPLFLHFILIFLLRDILSEMHEPKPKGEGGRGKGWNQAPFPKRLAVAA